ncbi:hypothetical protein [Streptomyces cinereoruber]
MSASLDAAAHLTGRDVEAADGVFDGWSAPSDIGVRARRSPG